MIRRVRIESEGATERDVQKDLDDFSMDVMNRIDQAYGQRRAGWQVTENRVGMTKGAQQNAAFQPKYEGRIVLRYQESK